MERVAFLIEETNTTIRCLLNPESIVVRRVAGVAERRSRTGRLTGANLPDTPLLYTGGGRTELELDLLFDTSLIEGGNRPRDVRQLTEPIWNLAENRGGADRYGSPSMVRFLWGKAWNVPGVVTSIAERLEQFNPSGAPQRSWLRMRLIRVADPSTDRTAEAGAAEEWTEASPGLLNGTQRPESEFTGSVPGTTEEFTDEPLDFPSLPDFPDIDLGNDEVQPADVESEETENEQTEEDEHDQEDERET